LSQDFKRFFLWFIPSFIIIIIIIIIHGAHANKHVLLNSHDPVVNILFWDLIKLLISLINEIQSLIEELVSLEI